MNFRAALAVAIALCLCATVLARNAPRSAKVRVDAVRMETLDRNRNVTGEVVAGRRSSVAAKASGLVLEMNIDPGDTIQKGDVIAQLDATLERIQIRRREAEVKAAEAFVRERETLVTQTQRDVDRLRALRERNGASMSELDDALTDLESANAQLARAHADRETANAELERTKQELENMTVRAPFTGTVVGREIELGQWIDEGETALELIELDHIDVYLDIPEAFIGIVAKMDRPIRLSFAGGTITRESHYTAIIDDADPEARTFPVRIRLDNANHELRPGMSVTGQVPTGELTQSLTVHKDAILRDDAGAFVYYDAGGKAMPARITPLYAVGNRTAVRASQLSEGTKLIIEGNERLYPSQPISIVGEPGSASSRTGARAAQTSGSK